MCLRPTLAINHLEDVVVRAGSAVLRYGGFYGPGANDDQVELAVKRLFPLVGEMLDRLLRAVIRPVGQWRGPW